MKFLCYDTALNEEYTLVKLMKKYPVYISLFAGTDDEPIWDAAPYLFEVRDNFYELQKDPFIQLEHSVVFETNESMGEVCDFLQYYIYQWPGNDRSYFRIWDARVLLRSLPQWDLKKRQHFFDFFKCFYTENERPGYLDQWQPGRLYEPAATAVLKTEVLAPDAGAVAAENDQSMQKEEGGNMPDQTGNKGMANEQKGVEEPPKKRRFFIG